MSILRRLLKTIKKYRFGIIFVAGLIVGLPVFIYGSDIFSKLREVTLWQGVWTILLVFIVGISSEWFVREAFR